MDPDDRQVGCPIELEDSFRARLVDECSSISLPRWEWDHSTVVQDARHGAFYDSGEDHAFLPNLAEGFSGCDLTSLICHGPFFVQRGRADMIGRWPQVVEQFARARSHREALGCAGSAELQWHEGGHVVGADGLVDWLSLHY